MSLNSPVHTAQKQLPASLAASIHNHVGLCLYYMRGSYTRAPAASGNFRKGLFRWLGLKYAQAFPGRNVGIDTSPGVQLGV